MKKPIVLSIANRDPTACTGLHVDLETLKNLNVDYSYSIITTMSAPNDCVGIPTARADAQIRAQFAALPPNFKPNAIKIGMIGSKYIHENIIHLLTNHSSFVVLDPNIISPTNATVIPAKLIPQVENIVQLLPYVDVVTPNLLVAEKILNKSLASYYEVQEAAQAILALGAKTVLLTGGLPKDTKFSQDYWTNGHESFWLATERLHNKNYRDSGCVLSAAITACLALGYSIKDALVIAKMYVNREIRQALDLNKNPAKIFHGGWPANEKDLPYLSPKPLIKLPQPFKHCKIGLYPIVDSSSWLAKLLPQGIKCIQLRIKDQPQPILEKEIKHSVLLAKKYGATLFINDYWELAIRFGAEGVHLGQKDLRRAQLDKIKQSGLYLGISTYCYYEVATAHAVNPSYIACGSIYPTISKNVSFQPQGIAQLQHWRRMLHYPLVAIGGITLARLPAVLKTGVDGVAIISAIIKASNPLLAIQQFFKQMQKK